MERPMKQEIAVILLLWLALQVPLGIVIGKCIGFGTSEARNNKRGSVKGWRVNVPYQFVTAKYRHRR